MASVKHLNNLIKTVLKNYKKVLVLNLKKVWELMTPKNVEKKKISI